MRVLYGGDSLAGGPANYLLGILTCLGFDYVHVPPSEKLNPHYFVSRYDAIILSDFPQKNAPAASQQAIVDQVKNGTGFLMVGGWGSFSGPFGHWRGSLIEKILPVICSAGDDRINIPSGALIRLKKKHPAVDPFIFKKPPVIVGLNRIKPKKESVVVLTAREVIGKDEYPLLVVSSGARNRTAAFAADFAPHWCGGLVDWGNRQVRIKIKTNIQVEIGNLYIQFAASLLQWLCSRRFQGAECLDLKLNSCQAVKSLIKKSL